MSKTFNEMTKAELKNAAIALKLEDVVIAGANNPKAITNAEYITVLEKYKADQELANPEAAKSQAEDEARAEETKGEGNDSEIEITPKSTPEEEKETIVADYSTMIPVIITDHDTSIAIEEDDERRLVAIRWGNPVIGMTTVNIPLHGRMQYVQKGAIIRLKKISLASHVKNENGTETSNRNRKRFSVADTTGWTEDEFKSHATEQALKKI